MPEGWTRIRDARHRAAADVDNVCLPVSADLGDMGADKREFTKRAADETLRALFAFESNPYPIIKTAKKVSGNTVMLTLENADGLTLENGIRGCRGTVTCSELTIFLCNLAH